ncbi:MAG: ABC transporter ATP-binding protein [Candidatus Methanomethylophilaceae archaeon]|nr:ABC transporter ATP-binding protein [Candidatus Methanomethylophilaceae archaeon]
MSAISVRGLRKSYGDREAVKGIDFEVPEGSFFAFLGPNGAGKSTTISIICSLMEQDSGEVLLFGNDSSLPEVRRDIGVVFQDSMMDRMLTVRENVTLRGSMYGLTGDDLKDAVSSAISKADAMEFADQRYGQLSGGQRRRADIARALVHSPRILLLDEPTSGLDPQTRKTIWETITTLNRESGMTIFLTTHYMEEASESDDVVIIDHGTIVAHGTPVQLREKYCSDNMVLVPFDMEKLCSALDSSGTPYTVVKDVIHMDIQNTMDALPIIESVKGLISSFEVRMGTLDDAFINITGGELE